jgi:hypothetical protein
VVKLKNMKYNSITYIGKNSSFTTRIGGRVYDFEWQKGLGIGRRKDEIHPDHAKKIAKWRDKNGKRMFVLE